MRIEAWGLVAVVAASSACGDSGATPGTGGSGVGGAGGASTTTVGSGGAGSTTTAGSGGAGGAAGITCEDAASFDQPNWCVEDITWPPLEITGGMLKVELNFVDSQTGSEIAEGIHVRVCARTDLLCSAPLAEGDADPAASSAVYFMVPIGSEPWDGYFEVTQSGNAPADIPPNLLMFHRPASNDFSGTTLGLVTNTTLAGMAALMGTDLKSGHGHLGIETWSCCDRSAPGVTVSVDTTDADTVLRYLATGNGLPDPTLTSTDTIGTAAIANVPTGNTGVEVVTVAGTFESTQLFLGDVDVIVRDGAVTTVTIVPEPR